MTKLYRDFTTQAAIDAEYNAAQSVPDYAAFGQHYAETSAEARRTLPCTLDIPYGPTLDETLDIFPAERPDAPVFIFLHGGYWRALTSKEFSFVALGLRQLGITTVVVNYSLCPKVSIDEITRQVRAASAWVLKNIAGHGGDPARVSIGGHSAGGHLSAMCVQTDWAGEYGLPRDPFVGGVLVSGIYDLRPIRYSYLQPALQIDEGLVQRSPLFGVRTSATPLLITWGAQETAEFARQSTSYHAAWTGAGNSASLIPQVDTNHFSVIHGFADPRSAVCMWLAQVLGVAPLH
jgi:arylformamidase